MSKTESKTRSGAPAEIDLNNWIQQIYNTNLLSDQDIFGYVDEIKYHGFDRTQVLNDFFKKVTDPIDAVKLIILCAIRGPMKASELSRSIGLSKYSIPLKGVKGQSGISFNRITAVTADIAAFYLKKLNFNKRVSCACPGWLQFPSAGSIMLPPEYREQHKEFSRIFSEKALKSEFDDGIYQQMELNAYYEPKLRLF
jgi:hypothetical protein